jgi:hypothetical protein
MKEAVTPTSVPAIVNANGVCGPPVLMKPVLRHRQIGVDQVDEDVTWSRRPA